MLSVCIPIYNFDVREIVSELIAQKKTLNDNVQIILIDDCSKKSHKKINAEICSKSDIYVQLEQNIGRAKIRNLFLKYAIYENLLFIDCDSKIIDNNYLQNYINILKKQKISVICGGRIYPKEKSERKKRLRWKYGIKIESKTWTERELNPNKSFMTNNFVVNREILEKIKFDERLSKYGHEDTLFGFELKKMKIYILHINNPILNIDIETNELFLEKTEQGIINLVHIIEFIDYDPNFINEVNSLKILFKLKKLKLLFLYNFLFFLSKPLIKFILLYIYPSIILFNIYKLGILANNRLKK